MNRINIHINSLSVERRIQVAFVSQVHFDPAKLQLELQSRAPDRISLNPSYVQNAVAIELDEGCNHKYILTYGSNLDEAKLLEILSEIEAETLEVLRLERLRTLIADA